MLLGVNLTVCQWIFLIMDNANLQRCRTCLAQGRKLIPLSAFSIASRNTLLMSDIFMSCAFIQIRPNDEFSQYACSDCVISAERAYLFRKQCEKSDKIWNKFGRRLQKKLKSATILPAPNFRDQTPELIGRTQAPADNKSEIDEYDSETIEIKSVELQEVKIEKLSCKYCYTIFDDEAKLLRHEFAHTIQPRKLIVKKYVLYGCRECSVDAKTADEFVEHCHKFHKESIENLRYHCKFCVGDFADLFELGIHVARRHRENLKAISIVSLMNGQKRLKRSSTWPQPCSYCTLPLKSHKEKLIHLNQEHGDLKNFRCKICGKAFFRENNLRTHLEIHEGAKKHMCQYCGRSFASSSNLIPHIRIHTGEKPFKCDKCEARFAQWASLRSHILNHVSEKNYECKECHKRFARPGTLRCHMRIHTGGPKHPCHLCPQWLTTSNSLKRHLLTHSNERACLCKVCGKGFNRMSNLKVHMRTHTGEKPHVCTICKKGFSQAHCLRSHNARYHKDDTAPT